MACVTDLNFTHIYLLKGVDETSKEQEVIDAFDGTEADWAAIKALLDAGICSDSQLDLSSSKVQVGGGAEFAEGDKWEDATLRSYLRSANSTVTLIVPNPAQWAAMNTLINDCSEIVVCLVDDTAEEAHVLWNNTGSVLPSSIKAGDPAQYTILLERRCPTVNKAAAGDDGGYSFFDAIYV